jgi:hypothetical protein
MFWTIKLSFGVDILAIFWLGECFGYFLYKIWARRRGKYQLKFYKPLFIKFGILPSDC